MLNEFDHLQLSYLRFVGGCSKHTARWVLLREFSATPIQSYWWKLIGKFWNNLVGNEDWLAHLALKESVQLSNVASGGTGYWAGKVIRLARSVGVELLRLMPNGQQQLDLVPVDLDDWNEAMRVFHDKVWHPVRYVTPDLLTGQHANLCCYFHWFKDSKSGPDVLSERGTRTFANHLSCVNISGCQFRNLVRFRCRGWPLVNNTNRTVDRCDRVCSHCAQLGHRHTEDERHVLLHCPKYNALRSKTCYLNLFENDDQGVPTRDINAVMTCGDQVQLARFLSEVWHMRFDQR